MVSMKDKKDMKDMKDIKLKSDALHFLNYDMNLDWLHCIVPNPKTKPIWNIIALHKQCKMK